MTVHDSSITTLSSREFNQDSSGAKEATRKGPAFITDRGRPAHVLLSIEQYHRLTRTSASVVELLAMPDLATAIDFEPSPAGELFRLADLS